MGGFFSNEVLKKGMSSRNICNLCAFFDFGKIERDEFEISNASSQRFGTLSDKIAGCRAEN